MNIDFKQGKLVWAGQSDTYNPSKVETVIKEIVDEAVKRNGQPRGDQYTLTCSYWIFEDY